MVMITTFVVDLAFDADGGSDRDVDQHLDDYEQDIAHGDKGLLQKRPSTTRNQMTTAATRMTNVVIKTKTIVLHVFASKWSFNHDLPIQLPSGPCDCYKHRFFVPPINGHQKNTWVYAWGEITKKQTLFQWSQFFPPAEKKNWWHPTFVASTASNYPVIPIFFDFPADPSFGFCPW